jgi:MFS family permease
MAAISIPAVVVPILGPVIGGLILNSLGWRWIFFVNVPICAAGLLLGLRYVRTTPARGGRQLDVLGLALVSPALAALLYGLSEAHRPGGFGEPQVYGPLAGGVLLLAAFVVHALRTRREPVVDLRLFRSRSFTAACLLLFLSGLSLFRDTARSRRGCCSPRRGSAAC